MNAAELSQRMSAEAATIAAYLLPGGKRAAGEWKCGSLSGEAGKSLSVRLGGAKAGIWADFATGEGGDLLDLWAKARGVSVAAAMAEAKAYLNIRDAMPERERRSYRRPDRPKCAAPKASALEWLRGRGLSDATIAAFRVGEQERDGKSYAVFPYLRDGVLVNVKYRNVADKRDMRQEAGAEPCLFGWHLIDPDARRVAICEGEIDAMTLHQMGIPALSVNAGAGNHGWLENDWGRLERFSEILVALDNDEAGEKGARELIHRLGEERCKRLVFPAKDANEYLQQGAEGADFWECARNAKAVDPEELRQAADFIGGVKAMFYPPAEAEHDPVLTLDRKLAWFEFRRGELTVWTGFNGHGKSLLLSQVMLGLAQQGERFVVFSGEMTPERQLKRMVKQATGIDRPAIGYIDAVGEWLRDRVWVFDAVGSAGIARLLEVFLHAKRRYGASHFIIDSLMMTDVPEDGAGALTAQKEAVRRLCDFARRHDCHMHLVAHPRKGYDETRAPGKLDVAGSSKITDGADNVFSVWSARKDESAAADDGKHDAKLELHKQRNGDTQRYTQYLYFVKGAGQFATDQGRCPVRYVDFSGAPVLVCNE